jgi:hypothetical protein
MAQPGRFDAAAWLAEARPYADVVSDLTFDVEPDAVSDARRAEAKRLGTELDAAVGWERACDTFWDAESQREVYEPTEPGGGHGLRGTYTVERVGEAEHVVVVTCNFGAYQGSYAMVHLDGQRAALLKADNIGMAGQPYGPPSAVYSEAYFQGGTRGFETFAKARGLGDCGILSRYEVAGFGEATLVQARARDCDDAPEIAPPVDEWPVVFPRP